MIKIGDTIYLVGGFYNKAEWLNGSDGYYADVVDFMPGQGEDLAMLVRFKDKITTIDGHCGQYAVLELRYEESKWDINSDVHIELCDFIPERKTWKDRKQGIWVESNATIRGKECFEELKKG